MEERSNDGWWQRKWWWWIRHSSMCKIRWNWRWSEFQRQGNAYWNEWRTCDFQTKVGWWLSNLNEEQVIQVSPMSGCDCESSVNNSVVCLGWCRMTCAGWLFLSKCNTSLLWQSIVVFSTELQSISPTTVCQSLKLLVASTCNLPDVINCQFREFAAAPLGLVHFSSPHQESGIHCLLICGIQLLTPNNYRRDLMTYLFAGQLKR